MPLDTAPAAPTREEDRDLVLERIIDVPRETLYRCWTSPELLVQWFCPKPWCVSDVRQDVRSGGNSYLVMNGPNGERIPQPGVYLEVIPNEKLVFTDAFTETWKPSEKPFMVGIVTFEDLAARPKVKRSKSFAKRVRRAASFGRTGSSAAVHL